MMIVLTTPIQTALAVTFLYQILGWSSFVGIAAMALLIPIPGLLASLMNKVQKQLMEATEERVGKVTETINSLRMLKMFAWEE